MTERLTDEALLPCPFCGGENVRVFGPVGWNREYGITHSCQTFSGGSGDFTLGARSRAQAIAEWNLRATPIDDLREENLRLKARLWSIGHAAGVDTKQDLMDAARAALSQNGGAA